MQTYTLAQYRQEMLTIGPEDLGEVLAIASLDAQGVTVTEKATGVVDASEYIGKYLLRPDATASADRLKIVTDFDSVGGRFAHEGDAYTDLTETSETLEVHSFEPRLLDDAINTILGKQMRNVTVELPALLAGRHWLNSLSWIRQPSDILSIRRTSNPVLSRNRYFDRWNAYDASGNLTPDDWTLAGSAATMARSTAQAWRSGYSVAITRAGTDATLTQTIGILQDGVSADTLRSRTVTIVVVAYASAASQVRAKVSDGVVTTHTSYHTGNSTWQELSAEVTLDASATTLTIAPEVNTTDGTAYFGECYLVYGSLTDSVRRDDWPGAENVYQRYDQSSSLPVSLPGAFGTSYEVRTLRPYPKLPAALVRLGSADALVSDAPLTLIATGAIATLYERLAQRKGEDTTRYAQIAKEWTDRWAHLSRNHLYMEPRPEPMMRRGLWAAPARRI